MILYGLEYKERPVCKRLCLKPEITFYGFCKDCLIERMMCCENCCNYDGQDCEADNENRCRCFTGDKNDVYYWRLKGE